MIRCSGLILVKKNLAIMHPLYSTLCKLQKQNFTVSCNTVSEVARKCWHLTSHGWVHPLLLPFVTALSVKSTLYRLLILETSSDFLQRSCILKLKMTNETMIDSERPCKLHNQGVLSPQVALVSYWSIVMYALRKVLEAVNNSPGFDPSILRHSGIYLTVGRWSRIE